MADNRTPNISRKIRNNIKRFNSCTLMYISNSETRRCGFITFTQSCYTRHHSSYAYLHTNFKTFSNAFFYEKCSCFSRHEVINKITCNQQKVWPDDTIERKDAKSRGKQRNINLEVKKWLNDSKFHQKSNFDLWQHRLWRTVIHFHPCNLALLPQNPCSILFCRIFLPNLFVYFKGIWRYNTEIKKGTFR